MERNKRTIWGTPNYIAPEVLSSKIGHTYEVDLWSLGVITYTMLFGRPPFETRDVKVTYRKIKSNNYSFPHHVQVSDVSKDFIKSLLKTDPKKRLSLDKIMKHEFFTNYPALLPSSTISCPPSTSYMAKYMGSSDAAPKPGCSPVKAPNAKDIATFEWDLIENDDAQIMSGRQASVQSHRRLESQEKFIKFNRPKDTVSNERDYMLNTDRVLLRKNKVEQSPLWSPAKHANYLQINLAKLDDNKEEGNKESESSKPHFLSEEISPALRPFKQEENENEDPKTLENVDDKKKSKWTSITIEKASKIGPGAWNKVLISKWIDYSSKYGLGYKLSNGIYGVIFNDSTKIVLSKDEYQFYYLKREISSKNIDQIPIPIYNFNNYPQDLKKKVILAQHFVSYLLGEKFVPSKSEPENFENGFSYKPEHVFLKKYSRENKAILFRLNNKIIQVVFLDKSELIS